jgi:hypothetical protein
MPGFALYYRDPNSQRVSFAQFVRVCFSSLYEMFVYFLRTICGSQEFTYLTQFQCWSDHRLQRSFLVSNFLVVYWSFISFFCDCF